MKKQLQLCAIALMLLSCGEVKDVSSSLKQLDFDTSTTLTNPSELLTAKYIKLETNEKCLISDIALIESTDEYIFILDKRQNKIFAFDYNGKHVGNIGRQGNGPKEFIEPSSFSIDNYNNCIVVVDVNNGKIIRYSLKNDFEFLSSTRLEFSFGEMEVTKNGNIICKNTSYDERDERYNGKFLVVDKEFKVVNSLVDRGVVLAALSAIKPMYKYNDEIFGYGNFETIIYKLSENESVPFYSLSFGDESIAPISFHKEITGNGGSYNINEMLKAVDESGYINMYSVYETSKELFVKYEIGLYNRVAYIAFWDKRTNKTYSYEIKDFAKKMNICTNIFFRGVVSDYFVASLNIETIEEKDGEIIDEKLSELINKSKEGDNPILLLFGSK